eukprot:6766053-Karenia_brevis.AAC.1
MNSDHKTLVTRLDMTPTARQPANGSKAKGAQRDHQQRDSHQYPRIPQWPPQDIDKYKNELDARISDITTAANLDTKCEQIREAIQEALNTCTDTATCKTTVTTERT